MPTIKNLTEDTAAVVGLPEDTNTYGIGIAAMYSGMPYLCYDTKHSIGWDIKIHIPPGSWSIVGWSDELTEEQMKGIVEGNNGGENDTMFMDYPSKDKFMCYLHRTATQSFASLLRSHGITDRALIIKKEK